MGTIESINVSKGKGGAKQPVATARLIPGFGIEGDGHAGGTGKRQVSLLSWESGLKMRGEGAAIVYGSFGENITTTGVPLKELKVGDRLRIGARAVLEVTGIGKQCPAPCSIFHQVGRCIMPDEGVFCVVVEGGIIRTGDPIEIIGVSVMGVNEKNQGRHSGGER